jgi:phage terminase large subunit
MQIDWKNPRRYYEYEWAQRAASIKRIREDPSLLPPLIAFYAENPASFINDWGVTTDPRNPEIGLPTEVPFTLFPRQVEWVHWFMERWQSRENGITEKTREMGMSWLAVAVACTLCLFRDGIIVGFGSRKVELVDQIDGPKSLFWKARAFLSALPVEFLRGWDINEHAPFMRIIFPATGSYMTGEGGDGIGRGDRTSAYFVDESAYLERPLLVDAALSRTTNCRIDISTPNGTDWQTHLLSVDTLATRMYSRSTGAKIRVGTRRGIRRNARRSTTLW